jgi:hypothetical protein
VAAVCGDVLVTVGVGDGVEERVPAIRRRRLQHLDATVEGALGAAAGVVKEEGGVFLLPARIDLVIGTLWPGKAAAGEGRLEIVRRVVEPAGEVGADVAGVPVWRAGSWRAGLGCASRRVTSFRHPALSRWSISARASASTRGWQPS